MKPCNCIHYSVAHIIKRITFFHNIDGKYVFLKASLQHLPNEHFLINPHEIKKKKNQV